MDHTEESTDVIRGSHGRRSPPPQDGRRRYFSRAGGAAAGACNFPAPSGNDAVRKAYVWCVNVARFGGDERATHRAGAVRDGSATLPTVLT